MAQVKPKDEIVELLKDLPEDASLEDIQYHIYVRQKVAHGEAEAAAGQELSHGDVKKRLARWLEP